MSTHLANIIVNKKLVKMDTPRPTVAEVIRASGREPDTCDVFILKSEGDDEGERIEMSAIVDRTTIKHTIFLRCVPKDRNVGATGATVFAMTDGWVPAALKEDVAHLEAQGYRIKLTPQGARVFAIFERFKLPPDKFSARETDLLVVVPLPYPDAKIDMFYTEPEVTLRNGRIPLRAEIVENHLGRNWRRFSWHHKKWNLEVDDLITHVSFIEQRLFEVD